ncbi:MAG: glutamate synthase subunit alpha, partial [Deltaproteobacteria bacterium]|nr:glutamate synthase subunit alpha [Deltaproteobacteria bacterium]
MEKIGLYDPQWEHDACGVGFVCRLNGSARHEVVRGGIQILCNLSHRGAASADADSGDGAGISFRIPDAFLRGELEETLPPPGNYGLGMAFFPQGEPASALCRELTEKSAIAEGWRVAAWREVPVCPEILGETARRSRPSIWQFVVVGNVSGDADAFERRLYILRKSIERGAAKAGLDADSLYIVSLSARVVIYKGMMMASQVTGFYPDLADERVVSPFAVVHQRYSTNTFPSWRLAHPFRCLAHNGEINTIRGNRSWLSLREAGLASPLFGREEGEMRKIFPLLEPAASDSASLDNALEFLIRGGRSLEHAMAMLIPQAWGEKYPMGPDLRGFFEFHAGLMEPWDGPAAVVFTDGFRVGACLDRNGLRPARYLQTRDGLLVLSSETGVLDLPDEQIIRKGALRPGQMLLADMESGRLIENAELKGRLARLQPYRRWVAENRIDIPGFFSADTDFSRSVETLPFLQCLFGYTRDDLDILLAPMAEKALEPVGSMGADIPLPILDARPQPLFSYFRQQFAQITNPPLDPIRESLVMSLMTFIGYQPNILREEPQQARLIKLRHPILSNDDLLRLRSLHQEGFACRTLDGSFRFLPEERPGNSLARSLNRLEQETGRALREGAGIIIVSDKQSGGEKLPIPALLAVAAVNRKLRESGEVRVGLICETGEAREGNHVAMLLSLGATAVNPWLAFESVGDMAARGELSIPVSPTLAIENYVQALCAGLRKIMSKMGISTLRGYRGAGIFEALGLGENLMRAYFPSISSRIGGVGLEHIERTVLHNRDMALKIWEHDYSASPKAGLAAGEGPGILESPLPVGGAYRYRRNGEAHLWTPETITLLQRAVRNNDQEAYRSYARQINAPQGQAFTLRHLLAFAPDQSRPPVPLEEVEAEESIIRRF